MAESCDTKSKVKRFSPKGFDLFEDPNPGRDHDLEKLFRQVLDIECYLQNNISENNMLLFDIKNDKKEIDIRGYTFQFNFQENEKIRLGAFFNEGNPLSYSFVNLIGKNAEFEFSIFKLLRLYPYDYAMYSVPLFTLYCLYGNFFTIELHCKCKDILEYNEIDVGRACCVKCRKEYKYKVSFRDRIAAAVEACHKIISSEKISLFNKKRYERNCKSDICHIYRDANSCMVFSGDPFTICHRHQKLISKQLKSKTIIITNDIDIFLKMPLDNQDIGFVSWDYPYIKVDRLNWDILEGRHVLFLLKGNDQTAYETSLEVKNALKRVNIKSFGYVNLLRTPKPKDKCSELLTTSLSQLTLPASHDIDNQINKEKLLGPYLQTGSVTVFYGEQTAGKTIFALILAQAMLQGVQAFKGWRESKQPSQGYYYNNNVKSHPRDYFSKLNIIAKNIFRLKLKDKYRHNPLNVTPLKGLSLTGIAKNLWRVGTLHKRKFIILDDIFQAQNSLHEQIMFLQELKNAGWCIVILADSISQIKDIHGVDNAIELIPMKPSATWKIKLKTKVKSSTIVPHKKHKNITLEFDLHSKRPTCSQVTKRKKITDKERKAIITFIKIVAKLIKNLSNERQARARKITLDKAIAEKRKVSVSLVRKLRKEAGYKKNKNRFVKIDHEKYSISPR